MEYSDLVKNKANDLVISFSNHLSDVSSPSLSDIKDRNVRDMGVLAFNLSDLSVDEKSQVLFLSEEILKFSYTFRFKGESTDNIYYERNTWGIPISLVKSAVISGFLLVSFLVLTGGYLLFKWLQF